MGPETNEPIDTESTGFTSPDELTTAEIVRRTTLTSRKFGRLCSFMYRAAGQEAAHPTIPSTVATIRSVRTNFIEGRLVEGIRICGTAVLASYCTPRSELF